VIIRAMACGGGAQLACGVCVCVCVCSIVGKMMESPAESAKHFWKRCCFENRDCHVSTNGRANGELAHAL
jgi:hypothetical protein